MKGKSEQLKDKGEQIKEAAMEVFLAKGYIQATTQEIAKKAQVAEMTIFRKFATKQNLFLSIFKPLIERKFNSKLKEMAYEQNTELFLLSIIEDRLDTVSRYTPVIRMLIAESMLGQLEREIDLPKIIYANLTQALDIHFSMRKQTVNIEQCAQALLGMFISHVIFPQPTPYYKLPIDEKDKIKTRYVEAIKKLME